ncbi:MAG: right-handed parallel beta-helix repeat-containing protein [Spirochaetales bacterium]|nr:right-handed parallel beta-helix repeat-containing protein [Spirochaetales bacterium]
MKRQLAQIPFIACGLILLSACQGPFLPDVAEMLAPGNEALLYSADFGLDVAREYRDDNQNLIVLVAEGNLPMYHTVIPSFSLSSGARIFPLTAEYALSFLQQNPHLAINTQSFIFSNDRGNLFVQELYEAVDAGQKVVFPPFPAVTIAAGGSNSFNYLVLSGSGQTVNQYRIVLSSMDESSTDIIAVTIPEYRNIGRISTTIYPQIDMASHVISGVLPAESNPLLYPYFIIPEGAAMQVAGAPFQPENGGLVDFSADVPVRVTSRNGYFSQDYIMRLVQGPSGCSLYEIGFYTEDNPGLLHAIHPIFASDGQTLTAEYPFGTDVSALTARVNISENASIFVGAAPFESGVTPVDMTTDLVLTVTSSDGTSSRDYTVHLSENRWACELLDISFPAGSNPGLQTEPLVSFNRAAFRIVVYVQEPWDTLSFTYAVSPGAILENALSASTGQITQESCVLTVRAADAVHVTEYTLVVVNTQGVAIPNPVHVAPGAGGSGQDWADPAALGDALSWASQSINPVEIRMKQGVYSPGPAVTDTFTVPSYTTILGGFCGDPGDPDMRDSTQYPTVINGDIAKDDVTDPIEPATYEENNNHLFAITGDNVMLDGVSFFHARQTAVLITAAHIRITNCGFEYNFNGGLKAENAEDIVVDQCLFSHTTGIYDSIRGGALHFDHCQNLTVTHTRFQFNDNITVRGGGIVVINCQQILVDECIFVENSSFLGGGAIAAINAQYMLISNCQFFRNRAWTFGGGAIDLDYGSFRITISRCLFRENIAAGRGGAVVCYGADWVNFFDSTFDANRVERDNYSSGWLCPESGGGLTLLQSTHITLQRLDFMGNQCGVADPSTSYYYGHHLVMDFWQLTLPDISSCSFSRSSAGDDVGYWWVLTWNTIR